MLLTDAALSSVASFNDSRCSAGGVCSTDPILFTCELKNVFYLRLMLPTGHQEAIGLGDSVATINLPAGFAAVSLNISLIDESTRNISLTLSIANASLLDDGEIRCVDTVRRNVVMAGCPLLLLGKSVCLRR